MFEYVRIIDDDLRIILSVNHVIVGGDGGGCSIHEA